MSLENKASATPVRAADDTTKPAQPIAQPVPQPSKVEPPVAPPAKPQS